MLPPSFLQSFSFYFSFLFYCLFTVYSLIEQVNTESWAPQSPAASGLFSLVIVVVAGHGALYPLSQQVRPQMLWLTGNVAIAAHVAVTCEVSLRVVTLGLNIQPLALSPLYLILLLIICSRGRNVEIFGLGSSSITTI